MKIEIVSKLQRHASRLCNSVACICVGMSRTISWVAEYRYKVTGAVEARYGEELKRGKVFARVTHQYTDYAVPPGGEEEMRLYREYTVVEHWRVQRDGLSNQDCLFFRLPFSPTNRCGLISDVVTTAEIEISVKGHPPDKSWESGQGWAHYDENWDPDGSSRELGPPKDGPRTESRFEFAPPEGAGDTTTTQKQIRPAPNHCTDWENYMVYRDSQGGYFNRIESPAPRGKYFIISSGTRRVSDTDPEGGAEIEETESDSRNESRQGLLAVNHPGNLLHPLTERVGLLPVRPGGPESPRSSPPVSVRRPAPTGVRLDNPTRSHHG